MRLRRKRAGRDHLAQELDNLGWIQKETAAAQALSPAVAPRYRFREALKAKTLLEFEAAGSKPPEEPANTDVSHDLVTTSTGSPMSSEAVGAAVRDGQTLTEPTRTALAAIAHDLGIDPERMEAAAIDAVGGTVRVTYTERDEDHEILIGAYEELDPEQRQRVLDFARTLREQST